MHLAASNLRLPAKFHAKLPAAKENAFNPKSRNESWRGCIAAQLHVRRQREQPGWWTAAPLSTGSKPSRPPDSNAWFLRSLHCLRFTLFGTQVQHGCAPDPRAQSPDPKSKTQNATVSLPFWHHL